MRTVLFSSHVRLFSVQVECIWLAIRARHGTIPSNIYAKSRENILILYFVLDAKLVYVGTERNGTERNGPERNGTERNGPERKGTERNGTEWSGKERNGKERKGKGKERKGTERKGKERKGTDRSAVQLKLLK